MTNEEVAFAIAELTPYAVKILKTNDVYITLEPKLDRYDDESDE